MKHLKLYPVALLALALSAFSCDKSEGVEVEEVVATLFWSGGYELDGCGYSIQIGETSYKPDNENDIDPSFKTVSPSIVELKYERLGKKIDRRCGFSGESRALDGIKILSMKKI